MRIKEVAAWLISLAIGFTFIVTAKRFLIPLFLALFIWYLINAINRVFQEVPLLGRRLPGWMTLTFSSMFILLLLWSIGDLIAQNINRLILVAPSYKLNLQDELDRMYEFFGVERGPSFATLMNELQLADLLPPIVNAITDVAKNFVLVLIYVIFLLVEQRFFDRKLRALNLSYQQRERLQVTLYQVNSAMRTYLGVKTLTSFLTGALSFAVLYLLDLDFAFFWAFLIFILNFIPTIGSIIATGFPALLSLLQFETLSPFFVILFGVVAIQILVGNIIEPRLMGETLNISPLVVILALILWSVMWGVIGMLLSVPITVAVIIICAQFPQTRPVAILLSKEGKIVL